MSVIRLDRAHLVHKSVDKLGETRTGLSAEYVSQFDAGNSVRFLRDPNMLWFRWRPPQHEVFAERVRSAPTLGSIPTHRRDGGASAPGRGTEDT